MVVFVTGGFMFNRMILKNLEKWADSDIRKPLVLRGARQVGKTTVVNIFSENFDQYIYLNLETKSDRDLFEKDHSIETLISSIFLQKKKIKNIKRTLIFIDEIQNSSKAISYLRYFYENAPDLFVITAGSLLETYIDRHFSFPVGRVEYLFMYPISFFEYLEAMNETQVIELLKEVPLPEYSHERILELFHKYSLVGGMPEIIQNYINKKDIVSTHPIFDGLLTSYMDDAEKYSNNNNMKNTIRHAIYHCPLQAGKRIKFHGFGNSNYRSREMKEALIAIEKAMLIKLIYPTSSIDVPMIPNHKKSPRLQFLDTGLVNYFTGLQSSIIGINNLDSIYGGKIIEHIVGQELLANSEYPNNKLNFWVKEKKNSNAEIDYIYQFHDMIIPIEVKSGATGRLRSLHQFIDSVSHNYAVRIYSGNLKISDTKTIAGKKYKLLNLPYYLTGSLRGYLKWFIS